MGAAAILVSWTVLAGSSYEICYQAANRPQACVRDDSGQARFTLDEDTDYSFSYRRDGVESLPLSFHTVKVAPAIPAPCPALPPLPPIVLPDSTLTYHPDGQTYKAHWGYCKDTVVQLQGLVARLKKTCGKKCQAVN